MNLPSFNIIDPRGDRLRVQPATNADTVQELARAAGFGRASSADGAPIDGLPVDGLLVDGLLVPRHTQLTNSGIHHGSTVSISSTVSIEPMTSDADRIVGSGSGGLIAVWVAGPDAGSGFELQYGTNIIGRSPHALIRCSDSKIELHHAALEVTHAGVCFTQLAGGLPVLIDSHAVVERTMIDAGAQISIGASVLMIRRQVGLRSSSARTMAVPGDPWRIALIRPPRAVPELLLTPIEIPAGTTHSPLHNFGFIAPVIGVVGAGIFALIMDQMMFLIFGLLGLFVAVGTWLAGRVGDRKQQRRAKIGDRQFLAQFTRDLDDQHSRYRAFYDASTMHLDGAVQCVERRTTDLWAVRAAHHDAFCVTIGRGDTVWQPRVNGLNGNTPAHLRNCVDSAGELRSVDLAATLGQGAVIGIDGPRALTMAVARSIVAQLAAASGPADWGLAVVADDVAWRNLDWLPHRIEPQTGAFSSPAELLANLDNSSTNSSDSQRHLVVLVDDQRLLASRTSPLRRLLASDRSVAIILLCTGEMPAICTSTLEIGRDGLGRWNSDPHTSNLASPIIPCGMSSSAMDRFARALAPLVDPERTFGQSGELVGNVGMIEILKPIVGTSSDQFVQRIATRWRGESLDNELRVAIGAASDGIVEIDVVADGPHGLIAGTTGSGKSELLRSLVLSLATRLSPNRVNFVLVDYKGGSTFDACNELPHVVGVVTDLDDGLATRALRSLNAELRRREALLRIVNATDLAEYRVLQSTWTPNVPQTPTVPQTHQHPQPLANLVVVIDEFASLAKRYPEFMTALLAIAQRGRSLGVHLLLATQRPSGVVTDDIRANTNLRISLRVQDEADANDVLGDPRSAHLPRQVPGRAVIRLGSDAPVEFQAACCTQPFIAERQQTLHITALDQLHTTVETAQTVASDSELTVMVSAIRAAARVVGVPRPHQPWVPQLRASLADDSVPDDAIGLIDDPDSQRVLPLQWSPRSGNLLLAGSTGSGTTTTLLAIAHSVATSHPLYVIDAGGDRRWNLAEVAAQGAIVVVPAVDHERLGRVLTTVATDVVKRKAAAHQGSSEPDVVVIIDGFGSLRSSLINDDQHDLLQCLDTIVADGQAVGVFIAISVAQSSMVPLATFSQMSHRWVFHLADAGDAAAFGVAAQLVPAAITGRLVIAESTLEAQVLERVEIVCGAWPSDQGTAISQPSPILRLPALIHADELVVGQTNDSRCALTVGVCFDSLRSSSIGVDGGDHLMIIGASRSGRSELLRTLATAWLQQHPAGWVGCIRPRTTSTAAGNQCEDVPALLTTRPDGRPALLIIDDAELVDDPTGELARLIDGRHARVTVFAAARPDSLRSLYGHWTQSVRRSRLGFVMASAADVDGDLLSATIPRRLPIACRPGSAWQVDNGQVKLIQIAISRSEPAAA